MFMNLNFSYCKCHSYHNISRNPKTTRQTPMWDQKKKKKWVNVIEGKERENNREK